MSMIKLYEVSDQYQFLLNDLYDYETGEVDENILARLNELTDTAENKCINITRLFKSIEATQEAIEKERKSMALRERSLKNQVDRLKDYLLTNMERCEIKKIECPQFSISLQKNPPAVEVVDKDEVPNDYDKQKERELDIAKIKEDLKNGVVIPGVRLIQRNSLRIR
jgi:hypothetical protein